MKQQVSWSSLHAEDDQTLQPQTRYVRGTLRVLPKRAITRGKHDEGKDEHSFCTALLVYCRIFWEGSAIKRG